MQNICLQNFECVGDDEVRLAFPFGPVGSAAPAVSVGPCLEMFVECKVIQAKVNSPVGPKVEFNCGENNIVSNGLEF